MKLLLITILTLSFFITKAQDVITLKTGDQIKCKVVEVGITDIKYKKQDSANAPLYVIDKSTVFMINYKDGSKDIIKQIPAHTSTTSNGSTEVDYKTQGFINFTTFGLLVPVGVDVGSGGVGFNIQSTFGAYANQYVSIYGGIALNDYANYLVIPAFAGVRGYFIKGVVTPILSLDLGYGYSPSQPSGGGIYVHPEAGVRVFIDKSNAFIANIGYSHQSIAITKYYSTVYSLSAFEIEVGFQF